MKLKLTPFVAAITLVASVAVSAQAPQHDRIDHAHLTFQSVDAEYKFDDGTTVTWTARKDRSADRTDGIIYDVVITQFNPSPKPFSLLTLGLQAANHEVQVLSAKASKGAVEFALADDDEPRTYPIPFTIHSTNLPQDPKDKINIHRIGFIAFKSRSCLLTIRAVNRNVLASTAWYEEGGSSSTGHDNNPPGPPH